MAAPKIARRSPAKRPYPGVMGSSPAGLRAALAFLCVTCGSACARKVTRQPQVDPQAPVVPSTLPRLRRAWTATNVRTNGWHYQETAPTFDGVLIAWAAGQGGSDVIALELATETARWRAPAPRGPESQTE